MISVCRQFRRHLPQHPPLRKKIKQQKIRPQSLPTHLRGSVRSTEKMTIKAHRSALKENFLREDSAKLSTAEQARYVFHRDMCLHLTDLVLCTTAAQARNRKLPWPQQKRLRITRHPSSPGVRRKSLLNLQRSPNSPRKWQQ